MSLAPQGSEVFQNHGDVALGDMVSGHVGDGLQLDLGILLVFSNLGDCTISVLSVDPKPSITDSLQSWTFNDTVCMEG